MIGRTLDGRYAIARLLGQGGMGAVYEARHIGTGRRVAIKIIREGTRQEEQIARFQREARAVGAIESDHIAQVFDTGRDDETGSPYIAMELLDGEDVQALLKRLGPLPVELSLRIALQACLGLERAHAAGVIHRDIKPANLFLVRKGQGQRVLKILDFGVAKVTGPSLATADEQSLTASDAMIGSPQYMSPEQARGGSAVDARSDLWSLGVTLFQCLSGRRPNEEASGLGELIISIITKPAPPLHSVAPWVPAEVAKMVRRALTIEPEGRYQSASELAAELEARLPDGYAIVDSMLVPLGDTTLSTIAPEEPSLATSSGNATLGTTGGGEGAAPRRSLGLFAGGIAAVALGVAGVAYLQMHRAALVVAPAAPAAPASARVEGEGVSAASLAAPASTFPPPWVEPKAAPSPASSMSAASPPRHAGSPGPRPPATSASAAPPSSAAPAPKVISDDETSRK